MTGEAQRREAEVFIVLRAIDCSRESVPPDPTPTALFRRGDTP